MNSPRKSDIIFNSLPPIYILPTHLKTTELHANEKVLLDAGGKLTYQPKEARIFLGRLAQKKRAAFELRSQGVWTEERRSNVREPPQKRRKLSAHKEIEEGKDSSPDENSEAPKAEHRTRNSSSPISILSDSGEQNEMGDHPDHIVVLKIAWLQDSLSEKRLLPFQEYLVYEATVIPRPPGEVTPPPISDPVTYVRAKPDPSSRSQSGPSSKVFKPTFDPGILTRAKAEAGDSPRKGHPTPYQPRRRFNQSTAPHLTHPNQPPKLHRATTSEFESDALSLPDPPEWVRQNLVYACLRSTRMPYPNATFLDQLNKIKESRLLTLDEIGVRAYSTSIAAIAAYPYVIRSSAEVLRLPGCEQKIAALWSEWYESASNDTERHIGAVQALENDEDLKHIKIFHEIWGVGPDTARKFYYEKGWKDIDDVVEYGWTSLNRVQQIGVKFYDEFLQGIPRNEVEKVADVIQRHARLCHGIPEEDWGTDRDMVVVIVGGYRRGKQYSGDVDVILSHRQQEHTKDLVVDVVASLEQEGWVTHTLTLNTTTSDRNQQTLPYRGGGGGHGFDSLDKALCVWQDPNYDQEQDEKNPNIHRRVDIIISSWRTVGCAVLGWSGGNTFQRDIRRFVKREKGWKFDSSGIRDRGSGLVLDLESPRKKSEGDTWLDREKRLMNGLGIGWRPAEERCTG